MLDYACGTGRHARWLAQQGFRVDAVDRNPDALAAMCGVKGISVLQADLEQGEWPFSAHRFDAVIVTNYLHRARFGQMQALLRPGGVLIYETFMRGNAKFGRPSSPDFLLEPGELLQRCADGWHVVAFEQGVVMQPRPAALQRICAVRGEPGNPALP